MMMIMRYHSNSSIARAIINQVAYILKSRHIRYILPSQKPVPFLLTESIITDRIVVQRKMLHNIRQQIRTKRQVQLYDNGNLVIVIQLLLKF